MSEQNPSVSIKPPGRSLFPVSEGKTEKPIETSIDEMSTRKTVKGHATMSIFGSGSRHEIASLMTGIDDRNLSGRSQFNGTKSDPVSQTELSEYPTQSGCIIREVALES